MNQGVQFHFIHDDIYKGGKDGKIPLYFLPLTSVTPIDDDNSVSNLNTCQTNAAKNRGINSFKKNKDRIIDALKQTGISEKDLNDFMKKFAENSKNPMILLRDCLGKMGKDFAGRYMNCNGIGDKDFADVLRDDEDYNYKINFLYSFTDGTRYPMDIWGNNIDPDGKVSLKTILYDKDDPRTVNLARNFWKFLNQGEKPYKVEDFEFLNQDAFIERCKGSKNNNDEFTIYDAKGKLNETGQLIYNELCKNLSNRINPEKILQHLEGYARETVSACEYKCREIGDYIDDVCAALAFKFNKEKYFPEEIYKPIKIDNEILNDSFATIHYFQCIVTACIMHFSSVKAEAYIRNNIIDGIIKVRTDFEKIPLEEFEVSEYAVDLRPAEKVKFIIKKFCGNVITEDVLEKILNTTTILYAFLFSNEARQVVSGTNYHTTQFTFLNSKDLFIEKNGEVKFPFPILYEVVTGRELDLPQKVMDAYTNFDTSNPELFDHEVTIDKLKGKEINNISAEDLVENIKLLRPVQLRALTIDKIVECIYYVQDPERHYTAEIKNGLLRVFVNINVYVINSLTIDQIVGLYEYMDINLCQINNDKLTDLVNYIKCGNNVPAELSEKVFKLLTKNNTVKRRFQSDEEFFAKIVEFQNVIDFGKFFECRYDRFKSMIGGDFNFALLKNFLDYLVRNIENDNVKILINGPFLNFYCEYFLQSFSIEDILEFFRDFKDKENYFSKFPYGKVEELIVFIRENKTHQDASLAKSILMQKVKYYPEFILNFTPEEIETSYNCIGAGTLKYLNAEEFTNLINYFLGKKSIGYEWLKKVLATFYFNKALFKTMQPQQIYELITYCQIADNDSEKQDRLKSYFNDPCQNSAENVYFVDFLKYVAEKVKVSEAPNYILKIVPQAINYVPIEQIYDGFDYFSDLIDEKFMHFNDLVNFVYDKKDDKGIKILQKILKNSPLLINEISNNEILLDLMEKDEELLNVIVPEIENNKFSLLMRFGKNRFGKNRFGKNRFGKNRFGKNRFGKNNYSVKIPKNIKSIFLILIEKNLFGNKSFYNFDFESRIFATKLYFDSVKDEEKTKTKTKTLLKKILLDSKYVLETITYVKNNSSKNSFVKAINEVISSEFKKLPLEAMLELSILDGNYKNEFISIFPNNISSDYYFIEILNENKYENLIAGMLQNENFKEKLSAYINNKDKVNDDNLFKLCKINNENIKNLINKERFVDWANKNVDRLNIIVNYFKKYVDDLSDETLKDAFTNDNFAVRRAVSNKRFNEILLKWPNLNSLKKNRTPAMAFGNDAPSLSGKIVETEVTEETVKSEVKMEAKDEEEEKKRKEEEKRRKAEEEEKRRKAEEEERKRKAEEEARKQKGEKKRAEETRKEKIEDKNETVAMKNENTEEKPSNKKRNIAFISSGIVAVSISITLLPLALLGFLSFGIGLGIAVGLFVIGAVSTGLASKFFDKEKNDELMERDPETYTKTEKFLYGWRKPIKERIENFDQTDKPKSENSLSQKEM